MGTKTFGRMRAFRKMVGMILCMVMIVGIMPFASLKAELTVTEPVDDTLYVGDVDGDGSVTPKDVTKMRRFLAGGWNVDVATEDGDVDGDGAITPKDVTKLRRYLAGGWGVGLPIKEEPIPTMPPIDEFMNKDTEIPLENGEWTILDLSSIYDWFYDAYGTRYRNVYQIAKTDENGLVSEKIYIICDDLLNYTYSSCVDMIERDAFGRIVSERFINMSNISERDFYIPQEEMDSKTIAWTFYNYDEEGNLIKRVHTDETHCYIWSENYEYDNGGKVVRKTRDELGKDTITGSYIYDANGNLIKEEERNDEILSTVFYYDNNGNINKAITVSNEVDFTISEDGTKVTVSNMYRNGYGSQEYNETYYLTLKNGQLTVDSYDEYGTLNTIYSAEYNNVGQLVCESKYRPYSNKDYNRTTNNVYREHDSNGNLTKMVFLKDEQSHSNGEDHVYSTARTFEKEGQILVEKNYYRNELDGECYYTFDSNGLIIEENDNGRYRYVYEYDAQGKKIKEYCFDGDNEIPRETYDLTYDSLGRVTKDEWYSYEYDADGYGKKEQKHDKTEMTNYPDGSISSEVETYDNETKYTYYYDPDGAITKISLATREGDEIIYERECDSEGKVLKQPIKKDVLSSWGYVYYFPEVELVDADDQILKRSKWDGSWFEYEYDSEKRVIKEVNRSGSCEYEYMTGINGAEVKSVNYNNEGKKTGEKYCWYNEDGKLTTRKTYFYSTDYELNPLYEEWDIYTYDDERIIQYKWLSTRDNGSSGGYTYSLDEYGFLVSYSIPGIDGFKITAERVPDETFRNYILNYDTDGNKFLTYDEIKDVTYLDCSNMGIKDLTGIKFLTELKSINCCGNPIKVVDVSYNINADIDVTCDSGVTVINAVSIDEKNFPDTAFRNMILKRYDKDDNGYLQENELSVERVSLSSTSWDDDEISYGSIEGINCFWNMNELVGSECSAKKLDLGGCYNLEKIDFSECYFNEINLSDCINLKDIVLDDFGNYNTLDISNCVNLKSIYMLDGSISSLDISKCVNLEKLYIAYTGIKTVDVSNNPMLKENTVIYEDEDD
jgi:hypothetical protein